MVETPSPAFVRAQRGHWPEAVPWLLRGCEAIRRRLRLPGKTVEAKSASAYLEQDHSYEVDAKNCLCRRRGRRRSWDLTMMMRRSQAESRFTGSGYFFLTKRRMGVPENP